MSLEKLANFPIGILYGFCMEFVWKLTIFQTWKKYNFSKHGFYLNTNLAFSNTTLGFLKFVGEHHTWKYTNPYLDFMTTGKRNGIFLFPNMDFSFFHTWILTEPTV